MMVQAKEESTVSAFTHYWTNDTCDFALAGGWAGAPFDHTASNMFSARGLSVGDYVYAITVRDGELFLVGRMKVARIVHSDEEAEKLLGYEPWSAADHLIADRSEYTVLRFDRSVPLDIVRQLRFESADGPKAALLRTESELDQQTLRGVRKLTASSVRLLDSLIQ